MTNQLYYGDNLDVLREHIADESIDLVYLDPPFNSNRNYNVLFREKSGESSPAQIEAFTDTWQWDQNAEAAYHELTTLGSGSVSKMIEAMRQFVGSNDMMAYLVMMAQRIVELHRVLKPTGSLYLHCDPTASHYLKILLDTVFGKENFRNEIIWRRTGAHNKTKRYGPIHDTILFYTRTESFTWNSPKRPYMLGHVKENFTLDEKGYKTKYYGNVLTGSGLRGGESGKPWRGYDPSAKNRHWAVPGALVKDLDEAGISLDGLSQHEKFDLMQEMGMIVDTPGQAWPIYQRYVREGEGQAVGDIWAFQPYTEGTVFGSEFGIDEEVRWLSPQDQERLGYPTQKPEGLLERIIEASSNPGDVVLDPFCGCGTAVVAAQKLGRQWIGIDITHLAVSLIRTRLIDTFGDEIAEQIEVIGDPKDAGAAKALFDQDPFQFEWWALSLVNAMPANDKKKGADRGIDGEIRFHVDNSGKVQRCLVQVKGGHVNASVIRDLKGTMEREKAVMGILVTMQPPSKPMRTEALEAGFYTTPTGHDFSVMQILTIEELLGGAEAKTPNTVATFAKAQRHREKPAIQRLAGLE